MQNYNNFSNKKNSSIFKINNDLNDNSISFESKNDKNEKDLDDIVYLEESDIIKSRIKTKNIKNRDSPSYENSNSSHIKAKSNYNYFESRYTKKIKNDTSAQKPFNRRTKSEFSLFNDEKDKDENNNEKTKGDYSSKRIPLVSKKGLNSASNQRIVSSTNDIFNNSYKQLPFIRKKNDEKNDSKKAIPFISKINPNLKKDKSCKQLLVFTSKLSENSAQKEYSSKKIPLVNKKGYSSNQLPFVHKKREKNKKENLSMVPNNSDNIEKKENLNKKIPFVSKKIKSGPLLSDAKINNENDTTKEMDNKEIVRRRKPNFPKYERRISDKNINVKKKEEEEKKNVRFEQKDKIAHTRKKSIEPGRRKNSSKHNKIDSEFSTTTYIKLCEALSSAGRDDDGLTKTNQDTYILERNINGVLNFNIFGVLDGHGLNGHFASQFVRRYILSRIKNHPFIKGLDTPKEIYKKLTENGYQIIANIFIDADAQIRKEKFNCEMSGTTCVIVIQLEEHLICANTGDSRAILVYDETNRKNKLKHTKIYLLSYDCKPDLPNEKKRIEECGGSVQQIIDDETDQPCGPFRVWIKGEEYPGLAMSRSIGDLDAKTVGVIPNPQIVEYTLDFQSRYMLICSDGIWEFMSNEEVMKIANKYYLRNDAKGICQDLTNISTSLWLKEDIVVDDITVVVVFF